MVTQSEMTSTRDMQVEIRAKLAHLTQQFQTLLDECARPPGERQELAHTLAILIKGFKVVDRPLLKVLARGWASH